MQLAGYEKPLRQLAIALLAIVGGTGMVPAALGQDRTDKELLRGDRVSRATSGDTGIRLRAENLTLLPQSQPVAVVRVWNAGAQPYAGSIALRAPESWKLTPLEHAVQLAPGEETRLSFSVENAVEAPENLYPIVVRAAADGDEVTVHRDIQVATAPYLRPTIDGETDDWSDAVPVMFRTGQQQTVIRTAWHRRAFFVLVVVEEDALQPPSTDGPQDAVQLALATRDAAAAQSAAAADRFEFLLVPGSDGSARGTCYCLMTPGTPSSVAAEPRPVAELPVRSAELIVRRGNGKTYYECSLPWGDMQSYLKPAEGREFNLSVLIHDPDGTGLRDWGEAAGLWESQRNALAWSTWRGARWRDTPPMDSRTPWGLCSSRY
ncbi:MAG: hypothetical protein MUF48_02200 [Pirellulaceae bacterium]|nr:hypothetical protein [Pirellulaceae bacterium]